MPLKKENQTEIHNYFTSGKLDMDSSFARTKLRNKTYFLSKLSKNQRNFKKHSLRWTKVLKVC